MQEETSTATKVKEGLEGSKGRKLMFMLAFLPPCSKCGAEGGGENGWGGCLFVRLFDGDRV